MASPYGYPSGNYSGGFDPGYGLGGFGPSYQDQIYQYQKAALAQQIRNPFTAITTAKIEPEVRKALPVIEEFEWLRNRVNEFLWKSDKPASQVQVTQNGPVYCS